MIITKVSKTRKILANNIVFYRLKKGWSQEDFAEVLKTTPTYVFGLENTKRNTTIDYVDHITNTLGVNVKDLFTERPKVDNHRKPRQKKNG